MEYLKLCDSDYRFMTIVWDNAPVSSGRLVQLCNEQLGWKKSTTYTAIKKLAQKGYLVNENAVVSVIIPRERVQHDESNYFVERTLSYFLIKSFYDFIFCTMCQRGEDSMANPGAKSNGTWCKIG